jgi:hypothetical protein
MSLTLTLVGAYFDNSSLRCSSSSRIFGLMNCWFCAILDSVAGRIHGALEAFDKDCVSLNLFTSILAGVEKFAWMLRAQSD